MPYTCTTHNPLLEQVKTIRSIPRIYFFLPFFHSNSRVFVHIFSVYHLCQRKWISVDLSSIVIHIFFSIFISIQPRPKRFDSIKIVERLVRHDSIFSLLSLICVSPSLAFSLFLSLSPSLSHTSTPNSPPLIRYCLC